METAFISAMNDPERGELEGFKYVFDTIEGDAVGTIVGSLVGIRVDGLAVGQVGVNVGE